MQETKLLFLDIDGTLINHSKQITPLTKEVIRKLRSDRGIKVILISARMPKSLEYICSLLDIPVNFVAFNGSIIKLDLLGSFTYQIEDENLLQHSMIIDCHEIAKDFDDMSINIYTENVWLTNNTDRWTRREMTNTLVNADVEDITSENIQSHLLGESVHKVLFRSNPENVNALAERLSAKKIHKMVNFTKTKSKLIELTPFNIHKGYAVQKIAELTDTSPDQMMAFGDADNDVEMLAAVKFGFAMQGANARLAEVAYEVVGSNDSEGVAKKLEEIFF